MIHTLKKFYIISFFSIAAVGTTSNLYTADSTSSENELIELLSLVNSNSMSGIGQDLGAQLKAEVSAEKMEPTLLAQLYEEQAISALLDDEDDFPTYLFERDPAAASFNTSNVTTEMGSYLSQQSTNWTREQKHRVDVMKQRMDKALKTGREYAKKPYLLGPYGDKYGQQEEEISNALKEIKRLENGNQIADRANMLRLLKRRVRNLRSEQLAQLARAKSIISQLEKDYKSTLYGIAQVLTTLNNDSDLGFMEKMIMSGIFFNTFEVSFTRFIDQATSCIRQFYQHSYEQRKAMIKTLEEDKKTCFIKHPVFQVDKEAHAAFLKKLTERKNRINDNIQSLSHKEKADLSTLKECKEAVLPQIREWSETIQTRKTASLPKRTRAD